MKINGTVEIELDWEQEVRVVSDILKRDYASLAEDVLFFYSKLETLDLIDKQDYEFDLEIMKNIEGVLQNYMIWSEWAAWREKNAEVRKLYTQK